MALERTELIKGQLVRIATAHESAYPKLRGRLLIIKALLANEAMVRLYRCGHEDVWIAQERLKAIEAVDAPRN